MKKFVRIKNRLRNSPKLKLRLIKFHLRMKVVRESKLKLMMNLVMKIVLRNLKYNLILQTILIPLKIRKSNLRIKKSSLQRVSLRKRLNRNLKKSKKRKR